MTVLSRLSSAAAQPLLRRFLRSDGARGYGSAATVQLDYDDDELDCDRYELAPESDSWGSERGLQWVIMGDPMAKRHVYAQRLSKLLGVPHISMGTLVRQELHPHSSIYKHIANSLNQGKLVSEDVIFALLSKRLEEGQSRGESGFILDGIPRTKTQAEILDQIAEIDLVVNLKSRDECLLKSRFREAKGILLNSFQELEPHAFKALTEDKTIPPVYPIGPILNLDSGAGENDPTIQWLDTQPESSVLFLCFGSMGSFDQQQNREIAKALEKTGTRFLWSLRKPQPKGVYAPPGSYEDPGEILSEGFLTRTEKQGRVIGWAPQAAVLGHPAVAGFVTHCGWNSVLESAWSGVPVGAWPLYAEQQVNALTVVEEIGIGVEVKMDYRKEVMRKEGVKIVSAEVIGDAILKVMDSESGVRSRVMEVKRKCRMALVEGGSSNASLTSFLNNFIA